MSLSTLSSFSGRKSSAATSNSKVSFNRFSVFVKSGSENYILGKVNVSVSEAEVLAIVQTGEGRYSWVNNQPPYSCVIASPKKEAKFKGLKSYIAYQLTPSVRRIMICSSYIINLSYLFSSTTFKCLGDINTLIGCMKESIPNTTSSLCRRCRINRYRVSCQMQSLHETGVGYKQQSKVQLFSFLCALSLLLSH